jgi:hypothetical protein
MSYSTDSYAQEDTCTFPVYQRLRKLNPYAYYSLDAQKQMQQDLREAGSLVFFEQDEDTLPEPDEAVGLISLPDALSEADNTSSPKSWLTLWFPIPQKSESVCALIKEE